MYNFELDLVRLLYVLLYHKKRIQGPNMPEYNLTRLTYSNIRTIVYNSQAAKKTQHAKKSWKLGQEKG